MDKQRTNPIVPERDDKIDRDSDGSQVESYMSRDTGYVSNTLSSGWKLIAILSFLGMLIIACVGWQQYQQFIVLQERFQVLDSRLNNTDESVNQSGVAMQVNISNHSEQLKKHWSEIRKLWGIADDKNKAKIAKNAKDIAFLANKRTDLEASFKNMYMQIKKDRANLNEVGENFFGVYADMDSLNVSLDEYFLALQKVQASVGEQDKRVQSNLEAVRSIDAFRRQINQKILELEKKIANQSAQPAVKPQTLGGPIE